MKTNTQETQPAHSTASGLTPEIARVLEREYEDARLRRLEHDEAARLEEEKAIKEFPARMRAKVRVGGLGIFLLGATGVFVGVFSLGASFLSPFVIAPAAVFGLGALIMLAPGLTIKAFQALDYLCDRIMCKKAEPAEGIELAPRYQDLDFAAEERRSLIRDRHAGYGAAAVSTPAPIPSRGSLGLFVPKTSSAAAAQRIGLSGVALSSNVPSDERLALVRSSSANRPGRK